MYSKVPVTITVNIPDCGEPYIFLPNAFTPNGDGKNDLLCVRSNIIATMTLIIYNRWGEKYLKLPINPFAGTVPIKEPTTRTYMVII